MFTAAADDRGVRLRVVRRHHHKAEVWCRPAHPQAVGEARFAALLKVEITHLHEELAIARRGEVPAGVARVRREIELAIKAPGPEVDEDALPLLGREDVVIDIGLLVDATVADDRQRDALCLGGFVVWLFFQHFWPIANREGTEVGDAERRHGPHVAGAERRVLRHIDFELAITERLGGEARPAEVEGGGAVEIAAGDEAFDGGSLAGAAGKTLLRRGTGSWARAGDTAAASATISASGLIRREDIGILVEVDSFSRGSQNRDSANRG